MSSPISLSELQQWTPDNLNDTAEHLNTLAVNRGTTMEAIQSSDSALEWTGVGRAGEQTVMEQHAATVASEAQVLRTTAGVAQAGAQALYGQQQSILATVQEAQAADFEPSDDWEEVADVSGVPPNSPAGIARQGIAASYQAQLVGQVGAFTAQEAATSAGITSSHAPLTGASMMDHTFKINGPSDPSLPAPIPADPPVNNGPVQTPWPPPGGVPASVANPQRAPTPPIVIAEHPPEKPDPQDHNCSIREIVDGAGEVFGGSATAAAGGVGVVAGVTAEAPSLGTSTIPIIAGVGGIATGGKLITDGIDDLSHCTNQIVPGK